MGLLKAAVAVLAGVALLAAPARADYAVERYMGRVRQAVGRNGLHSTRA